MSNEQARSGVPVMHLFTEGRSTVTLLLWVVYFMNLLILYSLSNWIPTVFTGMGYSQNAALLAGTLLQVGGTLGAYGLAWAIARKGFLPVLVVTFLLATISVALIGQPGLGFATVSVIVFIAGWCIVGGQPGLNTLAATYYPPRPDRPAWARRWAWGASGPSSGRMPAACCSHNSGRRSSCSGSRPCPPLVTTIVLAVLLSIIGSNLGRRAGGGERTAPAHPSLHRSRTSAFAEPYVAVGLQTDRPQGGLKTALYDTAPGRGPHVRS